MTEGEILETLRREIEFPPLQIKLASKSPSVPDDGDAWVEVRRAGETYSFVAELSARTTPRAFADNLRRVRELSERYERAILVTPFLKDEYLLQLQQQQLSGIDMSGNGVICVPNQLLVYRTGQPNQYPDSAPTKYAYRGTTSLVARVFLCRTSYQSLSEISDTIATRGGSVATSTISKALKRMESDLIIERGSGRIRLIQPEKLLDQLRDSYRSPKVTRTFTGSTAVPLPELIAATTPQPDLVLTGRSSVEAWAVMGRDDWPVLYTPRIDLLLQQWQLQVEETARFIDFELRQTTDPTVYFDVRSKLAMPVASPVETYLDLSTGDKREREVAEQIRPQILSELQDG
jgi:hypothetical protein